MIIRYIFTLAPYINATITTNSEAGNRDSINPQEHRGRNEFNPNPIIADIMIITVSET